MSTISISNLNPSGLNLFSDSENYLDEISENEFTNITGGITTPVCAVAASVALRAASASSYRCFQVTLAVSRTAL